MQQSLPSSLVIIIGVVIVIGILIFFLSRR